MFQPGCPIGPTFPGFPRSPSTPKSPDMRDYEIKITKYWLKTRIYPEIEFRNFNLGKNNHFVKKLL